MKAKSFQIKALKSQLQKDFDAVVLYGNNEGELNHAFIQLKQELGVINDAFHLIVPSKEEVKKTPFIATDEANTPSLIPGKRFIIIEEGIPFEKTSLIHFLENKKTDALLIVCGGNLNKSNTLRVEAEKNPRVLALSCYAPTETDIQKLISGFLYEHHKTISPKVLSELCIKLSSNQQVILQELEKLLVYLGDQKDVDIESVQSVLTESADANLENLCIALADGNIEETRRLLTLFLSQDESETSLFRAVRSYFEKLATIIADKTVPPILAVEKYLQPNQFRLKDPMKRQTRFWKSEDILTLLDKLTQLELQTRTTGYIPNTMISQSFLGMAHFAHQLSVLR